MKKITAFALFFLMIGSVSAHAESVAAGSTFEDSQPGKAIGGLVRAVTYPLTIFKKAGDSMQPGGTRLTAEEIAVKAPYDLDAETTG